MLRFNSGKKQQTEAKLTFIASSILSLVTRSSPVFPQCDCLNVGVNPRKDFSTTRIDVGRIGVEAQQSTAVVIGPQLRRVRVLDASSVTGKISVVLCPIKRSSCSTSLQNEAVNDFEN